MRKATKIFPSQQIKASKNIMCLASSSKKFQSSRTVSLSSTTHNIRPFHSTPIFEDKGKPGSPDPLINARIFDNVVVIEKDLASIINDEVNELNAKFAQTSARLKAKFLGPQFIVSQKDTKGHIEISTKGRVVKVSWNLTDAPKMDESDLSNELLNASEEQPYEETEDPDEKSAVQQEGEIEPDLSPKSSSPDINFDVNIFHHSSAVCIRCTAGLDSRLYILSVGKSAADSSSSLPDDEYIEVNDLSEELQQRLYDYLEELSITDLVAGFIRQFNLSYINHKQAQSLSSLLNFFTPNSNSNIKSS